MMDLKFSDRVNRMLGDHNMLPPPLPKQKSWLKTNWKWFTLCFMGLSLFCCFLFIRFFIIQPYKIPSHSMEPTILAGDRILINKLYSSQKIKRGDIIVFHSPDMKNIKLMKRVIGMPGEIVKVSDKVVYIGQKKLEENYTGNNDLQTAPPIVFGNNDFGPLIVPENSFFVLGDNRNQSKDSRHFGCVSFRDFIGKVIMIYWSVDSDKNTIRSDRIGKKIE
jgi:signal peptidase I